MSRIYVTGSSGTLGREILGHLTNKTRMDAVGVARQSPQAGQANGIVTANVLGGEWLEPGQEGATVIHCAGLSDPRRRFDDYAALSRDEIEPQVGFAETLAARGFRGHLVYLSSAAVYGEPDQLPIPETAEPRPGGYYALQKLAVENALALLAKLSGFRVSLLRVANPYGGVHPEQERGVIRLLIRAALDGQEFSVFGNGAAQRDYLHMSDFTEAIARVCATPPKGAVQRLNVGSGQGTSLNDLIGLVEEAAHRPIALNRAPSVLEAGSSVLDISRAHRVLNWAPQMPLTDGIARMTAAMQGGS